MTTPPPAWPHPATTTRRLPSAGITTEAVASAMANAIAVNLGEQHESLATYESEFRRGMLRACAHALTLADRHASPVLILRDAIPGFTLMVLRPHAEPGVCTESPPQPITDAEQAAAAVCEAFVSRTRRRVVVVETNATIVLLFPVADQRRNLMEMGLWHEDRP